MSLLLLSEPCLGLLFFMSIRLMKQKADPSFRDSLHLAPMPDSYDLDRGLLLAVQAIQVRIVRNFGRNFFRMLPIKI